MDRFTSVAIVLALMAGGTPPLRPAASPQEAPRSAAGASTPSPAGSDWPLWGGAPGRNQVNPREAGIPEEWDVEKGKNIKWVADLGSRSYGNPVVSGGKVFVGTNNEREKNPKITGDKGVVMCFRESDGEFLWQAVHDKLPSGPANDWPEEGICSSPCVEGNRVYYVSNRCELVCADVEGFLDGKDDGPFREEKHRDRTDADFIWILDMIGELSVYPHNMATSSPLIVGDAVFIETSNGIDDDHEAVPHPEAPSFIAVDKNTGKLLWKDSSPGKGILHGQWSSPAYGLLGGLPQVVFPGGDGSLYSFEPSKGKLLWKFDTNPGDSKYEPGGKGERTSLVATPVIEGDRVFIGAGDDPEYGDGVGRLFSIRVEAASPPEGSSGALQAKPAWRIGGKEFRRTISTVAVHEGLVYAADLSGFLHCLDRETGRPLWVHDLFCSVWGSPAVIDGKVFLGDEDGDVAVLRAGRELKVLAKNQMGSAIYGTPIAAHGVLFVAGRNRLFAIAKRPSSGGDWPMFRGNPAHTGVAEAPAGPAPAPRLAWTFPSGDAAVESSAAIVSGAAFVATGAGELIALDLETGKPLFRKKLESEAAFNASPLVAEGRVFLGDSEGVFHAFASDGGKEVWSFKTDAEIVSSANLDQKRLLFGSYDGHLYCLSLEGKLLWKLQTEGQIHATPAVADGVVVVAGCDCQLRAVEISTGKELSSTPMGGTVAASPVASPGRAYVATLSNQVLAIDWKKGSVEWTFEDPQRQFPFHASPALAEGKVIVAGRDKCVRALEEKGGRPLWTFSARGRIDSSPAVCGKTVFVGSGDGELHGIDLESGEKRFGFPAGSPITASPAIGEGRLVIGAEDGRIFCFDLRAPPPASDPPAPGEGRSR